MKLVLKYNYFEKGDIATMLYDNSYVRFPDNFKKIIIEYHLENLDDSALQTIIGEGSKLNFSFDRNKLQLVHPRDKYKIALLYDLPIIDARIGWLLKKMCVTSENLGFILTPFIKWHRLRIIKCYKAILADKYEAYFELNKEKNILSLTIDFESYNS